jgi:uncharacterized damage-inducible protein DinB
MEALVMESVVAPLKRTLDLNTRLLVNALDGLDDEAAQKRIHGTNHVAFLACHLVDTRHYLARALGLESESPFKEALEEARGIDDVKEFPGLDAIRDAWKDVSGTLSTRLAALTAADLEKPAEAAFPIEEGGTTLGCLTFLLQHDSYHLGQVALLRRALGFPAMSYR